MLLKRAKSLSDNISKTLIHARALSDALILGQHPQAHKGVGQDFWDYRPYDPTLAGDKIDWRQSAKREQLFVREKEHERTHQFLFYIDGSSRMNFTSHKKHMKKKSVAHLLALALAFYFQKNGENFSAYGMETKFNNQDSHIQKMADYFFQEPSTQKTSSYDYTNRKIIPILFSDFWGDEAENENLLNIFSSAHKGLAVQIADGDEIDFPYAGQNEFSDQSEEKILLVERCEDAASLYQSRVKKHMDDVAQQLRRKNIPLICLRNDHPVEKQFLMLINAISHLSEQRMRS